jgi:hypothetical protein
MKDKRIPHCRRGSILKSNIKNVERGKIDATNTQIHDRSILLAWYTKYNI